MLHRKVQMFSSLPPQEILPSPHGWVAKNNKNTQSGAVSFPQDFISLVLQAASRVTKVVRTRAQAASEWVAGCVNVFQSHKGLAPSWTSAGRVAAGRGLL